MSIWGGEEWKKVRDKQLESMLKSFQKKNVLFPGDEGFGQINASGGNTLRIRLPQDFMVVQKTGEAAGTQITKIWVDECTPVDPVQQALDAELAKALELVS